MQKKIELNFHVYPLVVGQVDKYIFSDWQAEGGSILLKAKLRDDGWTQKDIVWTSSSPQVAVVEQGLVQAMTTGITDITAALPDGSKDTCRVQVIDNISRLTARAVWLNTDRLVLNKGEGAALYPIILPADYFQNGRLDRTFTWVSSDESIVKVNHLGRVFAVSPGQAVISARSKDVGRSVSCNVEVIRKSADMLYADPLEDMDGGTLTMDVCQTRSLRLPERVSHQPVCWRSENPGIVKAEQDGTVTAYRPGTVKVWATFINGGWRCGYEIQVKALPAHPVTEVRLSREKLSLAAGERSSLYAVVFPATVLEKQLVWHSSDSRVLRIVKQHINLSGLDEIIIEGAEPGTAVVTGSCEEAGKTVTVSCKVMVTEGEIRPKKICLPSETTIELEEARQLTPVFQYEEEIEAQSRQEQVCWLSGDRRMLTVDTEGVVKGYAPGETSVFCISYSGLGKAEKELLQTLSGKRTLSETDLGILEKALSGRAFAVCKVRVREAEGCLYHLHAPKEAVTEDSVCLLWNRQALSGLGHFSHYEIYDNGQKLGETGKISYTVRGLAPQSTHIFEVAAIGRPASPAAEEGTEICRQSVTVTTRKAAVSVLDVTKYPYFAVGDGIASDTAAIQQAIDDCPAGGEVCLPAGYVFCCGALFLKSDMTFRVDGILLGTDDPDEYPPVVCRWEGYRKLRLTKEHQQNTVPVFEENVYSHASLLNAGVYDSGEPGRTGPYHTKRLRICGRGMINGNGFSLSYNEGPCWYTGRKGLPIPQSPKRDQNVRGRVIAVYNGEEIYISDVTVAYGPAWTIHPVFSRNVTIDNVKMISMANGRTGTTEGMLTLNGDGVDPDSSTHVNIAGCYFTVGDDAVAIKSGRNRQGHEQARPSAYIRVTDCVCVDSKGAFAIGSEQSGGVHDVLFQNLHIENITNFGLWIKSAPCRGGLVEDVIMRDCVLKDTGGAMQVEYNHGGDEDPAPVLPVTRRIAFEDLSFIGKHKFGVRLIGHPESPIYDVDMKDFRFQDFTAKRAGKFVTENCRDVRMSGVTLPDSLSWEDKL